MNIRLVKLTKEYKGQLVEMMDEWTNANEKIVPYAIRKNDYHNFDEYLVNLDVLENDKGLVPDSTFFVWILKETYLLEPLIFDII